MSVKNVRICNSNIIKFLAAALMVIDHVGLLFFPNIALFRYIGRVSMPLFAFAISEGCRYTKNKTKHFALLFGLALLCQIVYYVAMHSLYMCILVTFSLSVLTIYALQNFKKSLLEKGTLQQKILSGSVFAVVVFLVWRFCNTFEVDYGFWGCMLPVFASVFDFRGIENVPDSLKKWDCLLVRVVCMGVGLLLLCFSYYPSIAPFFALFSLPILLLYNGEKGKWNTKYFFYIFYPAHLVLLQVLAWIL